SYHLVLKPAGAQLARTLDQTLERAARTHVTVAARPQGPDGGAGNEAGHGAANVVGVEPLDGHADRALSRHPLPKRGLVARMREQEVAGPLEVRARPAPRAAERVVEAAVEVEAVARHRQIARHAVLRAHAAHAGGRGGARVGEVGIDDDNAAGEALGAEMVSDARAHDAAADDHHVRRRHADGHSTTTACPVVEPVSGCVSVDVYTWLEVVVAPTAQMTLASRCAGSGGGVHG